MVSAVVAGGYTVYWFRLAEELRAGVERWASEWRAGIVRACTMAWVAGRGVGWCQSKQHEIALAAASESRLDAAALCALEHGDAR